MATDEFRIQLMDVSPDQARRWLDQNPRNRRKSFRNIDKMVRDIKAGRWRLTHQGIAFDSHGNLVDGQNRLKAIEVANVTVRLVVAFNVDRQAMVCIDTGKPRNLAASALFQQDVDISDAHATVAKAMLNPKQKNDPRSSQEEVAFMLKHHSAIEWACGLFPKRVKRVTTAQLKAVIARASYSQDRERLEKFAAVMASGSTFKQDAAGVLLKKKMEDKDYGAIQGRRNVYKLIEWCLDKFLAYDTDVVRVGYAPDELYPLPEERQALKLVKNGNGQLHRKSA